MQGERSSGPLSASPFEGPPDTVERSDQNARPLERDRSLSGLSTRSYLLALSLALLLPLLLVAGYLAWLFGASERDRFEQQATDFAQAASIALERDVLGITTALQVLATAESLDRSDFAGFHKRAVGVAKLQDFTIALRNADGRQIVNSAVPWGEPLPDRSNFTEADSEVKTSGQPALTDYFVGIVNLRRSVGVAVPVRREDGAIWFLSASFDVDRLLRTLTYTVKPPWGASLIDRDGVTIANTVYPDRAGAQVGPQFEAARRAASAGLWRGEDIGGRRVVAAYRTVEQGWTLTAGAFEEEWNAALLRTLGLVAGGSLVLIAAAILGSLALARRISGPIAALGRMGAALGRGEVVGSETFSNREANAVARTLSAASVGLRERDDALRASSVRYRNALRVGRIGAWETDFVAGVRLWSPEGMALFGLDLPGGRGVVGGPDDEWRKAFHPEDRAAADKIYEDLAHSDRIHVEYRIRRPDGRTIWLLGHGEVTERDSDGAIRRLINVVADITDRKRSEQALADSEARLAAALKAGHLGVYAYDAVEDRLTWDAALYDLAGVPRDQPLSLDFFKSQVHPDDLPAVREAMARTLGKGVRMSIEYRIARPGDGATRWLVAEGETIFEGGAAVRHVGLVRDITAQKQAEADRKLLLDEMNHRVKNMLATVRAIAMQTLRGDGVSPAQRNAFDGRLMALSAAHDLLMQEGWSSARLTDTVERTLAPHRGQGGRILTEGGDAALSPKLALAVSLSLHELATNALKYGALSTPEGSVSLRWTTVGGRLTMTWEEAGGPPVAQPRRKGFGSTLIQRLLGADVGGEVRIEYRLSGVVCFIDAPLESDGAARA